MNQKQLAKHFDVSPEHFNAVVKGRKDAGKGLASKLVSIVGGALDTWMIEGCRNQRKEIVDRYISAFKSAVQG